MILSQRENRDKVEVTLTKFKGANGYDIRVRQEDATLQDYLDALNRSIEILPLSRARARRNHCAGCDLCCAERTPLTWIDVIGLKKAMKIKVKGIPVTKILRQAGYIMVDGPVVDIMLRRGKDDKCIFLNRDTGLCTIYPFRPMVCQAFICAPATPRAKKLWEAAVNQGEDELVKMWLTECRAEGKKPVYDQGYQPRPNIRDWAPNAFTGKHAYGQILIKDICTPKLWKQLIHFDII